MNASPERARAVARSYLTLASLLAAAPLAGQEPAPPAAGDTAAAAEEDTLRTTLVPVPVIFYQPETGLGFGATAVYSFYSGRAADAREGERILASSIAPVALYTTKSQIIVAARAELFPIGSPYRLLGEIAFVKFPTKFWGIGNDTPDELEEDYTPISFGLLGEVQLQIAPGWFFGVTGQFAYRELSEIEEDGLLAGGEIPGASDGTIVGLGLVFTRDTRESTWYPRSSSFHQLRATLYDGFFGSDFEFLNVTVDLRKYTPLFRRHVLALRVLGVGTTQTPPFDLMPQLGGDRLLRGYFQGRYRDLDLVALQAEYRLPLWWRIGGVVFGAAGQVAPRLEAFQLGQFHGSAGFGVRFLVARAEQINLRADFAWGVDEVTSGFYLNIGEAF
jgi:hypothetical protein